MYQIALCEDEKIFAETQEKICRSVLDKQGIDYRITVFGGSEDFLASFLQQEKRYNLILMDIIMDGIDGMALARQIRKNDNDATIIFITSSRDYALAGYDVNAFHYLMKPLDNSVLERLILADYQNKFQNSFLLFKSGSRNFRIFIKDIICLETVGRRVAITLTEGVVYFPGKIEELLDKLPEGNFVRCHYSFAINLRNTRELVPQVATAFNGKKIPVSRAFKKNVQTAFLKNMQDV